MRPNQGVMSESHSTRIDWSGAADVGKSLMALVPDGISADLKLDGDLATLSLQIDAASLEALRDKVDAVLALFADADQ